MSSSPKKPAGGKSERELWSRLREGDRSAYDPLVEHYLPLVKVVAGRLAMHLPSHVREEDLYSAGCLGLLAAVDNFDPGRDVRFETYAMSRIRGAMLDELRSADILSRAVRERAAKIRDAEQGLRENGRQLSPQAVAEAAGMSLDDLCDTERALHVASLTSLDQETDEDGHGTADLLVDEEAANPLESLEREELLELLRRSLGEKDRLLVVLYYHEELTLREIGEILGVSESRVSQMHTEMIKRLHYRMESAGRKTGRRGPRPGGAGRKQPPQSGEKGGGEWTA